ncbi:MAG TPA: hypothetical protein VMF13_08785 [Luteitalea sp.]|nr:hypothetical protein [Luteitalea sp.]
MSWPRAVDLTSPGAHELWVAESRTGARVTCILVVEFALPLRLRYVGAEAGPRERVCWGYVEALIASDQSLTALMALGWHRLSDDGGAATQRRLDGFDAAAADLRARRA